MRAQRQRTDLLRHCAVQREELADGLGKLERGDAARRQRQVRPGELGKVVVVVTEKKSSVRVSAFVGGAGRGGRAVSTKTKTKTTRAKQRHETKTRNKDIIERNKDTIERNKDTIERNNDCSTAQTYSTCRAAICGTTCKRRCVMCDWIKF